VVSWSLYAQSSRVLAPNAIEPKWHVRLIPPRFQNSNHRSESRVLILLLKEQISVFAQNKQVIIVITSLPPEEAALPLSGPTCQPPNGHGFD
jgi:hypothetical protein